MRRREGLLVTRLCRDQSRDHLFKMADEAERNRLVAEFSGVTDVDAERAQFYLESSGWNLHVSAPISVFFIVGPFRGFTVYYISAFIFIRLLLTSCFHLGLI